MRIETARFAVNLSRLFKKGNGFVFKMTHYRQHRTGFNAGSNLITGNNNIDIGSAGVAGESNRIRIGAKGARKAAFIAGVSGVIVANGVGVIVNPQGQLGTIVFFGALQERLALRHP